MKPISDFIRTAKANIGKQYRVQWTDGRAKVRILKAVMSKGQLVSSDNIYGAELSSKSCDWNGKILKVYIPGVDSDGACRDWNNRKLRYTVEFID